MKKLLHILLIFVSLCPPLVAESSLWPGKDSFGFKQQVEFLPADEAFTPELVILNDKNIQIVWQIAPGYYLYKHKFQFQFETQQPKIEVVALPAGKAKTDEHFGDVEVYYQNVQAQLQLGGHDANKTYRLEIGYQGCADAGLCYPPMRKTFDVTLPVDTSISTSRLDNNFSSGTDNTNLLSEQDNLATRLATQSLFINMMQFFGFGLLLALTPCILPMIPILSGLIAGQSGQMTTRKATALSTTYVVAMASAYALAGVVAGLAGQNMQATLQHPYVLVSFAAIFVLLSLSMFGFYELQLPSSWQQRLNELSNKQRGGTYLGVAAMGFLSALIASPCITPPLAAALLYISQTGDAMLGAGALFSLAFGMGIPLIVIGAGQGKFLPKTGAWMVRIKVAFGVILLGVAIWILSRVIDGPLTLVLWGALLLGCAVFMHAFESLPNPDSAGEKLIKALGLTTAFAGVVMLVGAATGQRDPLAPLSFNPPSPDQHQSLPFVQIKGVEGLSNALASSSNPMMLDFYADWCVACLELEEHTFTDEKVRHALQTFKLLQTDITQNDQEDQALLNEFELFGPPAVLFFDSSGKEIRHARIVGYLPPDKFVIHLQEILKYLDANAWTKQI